MRQMQKGQHIGKFVIEVPDDETQFPLLPAQPRFSFSPTSSYLLVGGLRGIGRAIARWMVEYGARDFLFLSRSAGSHEEDRLFAQELESQGCRVVMIAGSAADSETVHRAIREHAHTISGVIQMSAVLKVITTKLCCVERLRIANVMFRTNYLTKCPMRTGPRA